jgi:hypothetical protein
LDTQSIIAELESQLEAINQALAALRGHKGSAKGASPSAGRPKRHLSAAAKRRIGEAMKKRWAERKKKAA